MENQNFKRDYMDQTADSCERLFVPGIITHNSSPHVSRTQAAIKGCSPCPRHSPRDFYMGSQKNIAFAHLL